MGHNIARYNGPSVPRSTLSFSVLVYCIDPSKFNQSVTEAFPEILRLVLSYPVDFKTPFCPNWEKAALIVAFSEPASTDTLCLCCVPVCSTEAILSYSLTPSGYSPPNLEV